MSQGNSANVQQLATRIEGKLDLNESSLEELQLANVVNRNRQQLVFVGYGSDDDHSDEDEEDGKMHHVKEYHDNGNLRYFKSYQVAYDKSGRPYDRMVEEKHFDTNGVCRVDIHFALGQPYLYRKHFWPRQTLKSESVFWVEDEKTMLCRKAGWWRQYYEGGNIKSEMQYNKDGVRIGFCKRYAPDGAIEWVKDYTKEYQERIEGFNTKKGNIAISILEAANMLGFDSIPSTLSEVNSRYRTTCAPLHPDKKPDPESTEKFVQLSRARDILKDYFENIAV